MPSSGPAFLVAFATIAFTQAFGTQYEESSNTCACPPDAAVVYRTSVVTIEGARETLPVVDAVPAAPKETVTISVTETQHRPDTTSTLFLDADGNFLSQATVTETEVDIRYDVTLTASPLPKLDNFSASIGVPTVTETVIMTTAIYETVTETAYADTLAPASTGQVTKQERILLSPEDDNMIETLIISVTEYDKVTRTLYEVGPIHEYAESESTANSEGDSPLSDSDEENSGAYQSRENEDKPRERQSGGRRPATFENNALAHEMGGRIEDGSYVDKDSRKHYCQNWNGTSCSGGRHHPMPTSNSTLPTDGSHKYDTCEPNREIITVYNTVIATVYSASGSMVTQSSISVNSTAIPAAVSVTIGGRMEPRRPKGPRTPMPWW